MNLFWSSIQTVKPALYSRLPKCDFERRYKDNNPEGREAAEILERAAEFVIQENGFHKALCGARDDWLLPGIGTIWHRYEPTITEDEEDGEERLAYETVASEHVLWTDFLFDLAPSWEQTRWVAKRIYLTKSEIKKKFPEVDPESLAYTTRDETEQESLSKMEEGSQEPFKRVKVWEIWDKTDRKVYWHAENNDTILDVKDDFARLMNFFPCCEPLKATTTTDSQIPVADFSYFQDQQALVDLIVTRKSLLIQALRLAGVRDSSFEDLDRLINDTDENQLIPVENWQAFLEGGGFEGVLQFMPLKDIAGALQMMEPLLGQEKQQIYEITGFSDILRGATNPYETAHAQDLKMGTTNLRLSDRQTEIQRFARDNVAIIAELIAEHFSPQTLTLVTGRQASAGVMKILKSDGLRSFTLDIETDSTNAVNKEMERKDRLEAVQAIGTFMDRAMPAAQTAPELLPFMAQALLFVTRSFKATRTLETTLEKGLKALMERKPDTDKPDPDMAKVQMQTQIEQQKMQLDMQAKMAELQQKQQEMQQKYQLEMAKLQGELDIARQEISLKMGKAVADAQTKKERNQNEMTGTLLNIASQERQNMIKAGTQVTQAGMQAAVQQQIAREKPKLGGAKE
jgi:hypothetical protein